MRMPNCLCLCCSAAAGQAEEMEREVAAVRMDAKRQVAEARREAADAQARAESEVGQSAARGGGGRSQHLHIPGQALAMSSPDKSLERHACTPMYAQRLEGHFLGALPPRPRPPPRPCRPLAVAPRLCPLRVSARAPS